MILRGKPAGRFADLSHAPFLPGQITGIEVKASATVGGKDFKVLRH